MVKKGQVLGVSKGAIKERVIFINQMLWRGGIIQTPAVPDFLSSQRKFLQHNQNSRKIGIYGKVGGKDSFCCSL